MDYTELKKLYKKDDDYADRTFELEMYKRVLDGTMYDAIQYPFFKSFTSSFNVEGSVKTPVLLSQRRPSVRYRLAKVAVDNSVSLLFGEGRFPFIECADEETKRLLNEIVSCRHLNLMMIDCATKGSIGSAVIFVRLINGKLFFEACSSEYFSPRFDPEDPDQIIELTQKYKVDGKKLIEMGYDEESINKKATYWFQRTWDEMQEIYYIPWECSEEKPSIRVDKERTVSHNLGFVPAIWVKNLPGGEGIDGLCTFKDGIDTNIELDYQMSQGGRGLKYSSEPLLVIRGGIGGTGNAQLSPGDILNLDENGDAKHVEISGDACKAVLEFCKILRDIVLENIHGNRTTPEKTNGIQSGKALEMMNMALVWLASKLRISYGEHALVCLMKMIVSIAKKTDIMVGDERVRAGTLKDDRITLVWPAWFPMTAEDRFKSAQTVRTLKDSGLMSVRTAVTTVSDEYDVIDIEQEIKEIEVDREKFLEETAAQTQQKIQG